MRTSEKMGLPRCLMGLIVQLLLNSCGFLSSSVAAGEGSRSFVLELTADSIAAAIAKHDAILVEFYAPWCGHCKRLAPEFEKAAQLLAENTPQVKLAKIDADKYKSISAKYDIAGYPTLRLFTNGLSTETEYDGPRKAEALVSYVRRTIAPVISSVSSDSELNQFLKNVSDSSPIFLGFGLEAAVLKDPATKYRKKAWFAVVEDFSEKVMMEFDFDKRQALVVTHPHLMEQAVFYGPFGGVDMDDFVKQNLMPLVSQVSAESLKLIRDDGRPIALGIYDGQQPESYRSFMKMMKSAAPANRAFIFANVDAAMWPSFVRPFGIDKSATLPTVIVWNGLAEYSSNENADAFIAADAEARITNFLQDFKDNKVKRQRVKEPSFLEKTKQILWGLPTLYMILTIFVVVWLLQGCTWKDFLNDSEMQRDEQRERLRRIDLEGDLTSERVSRDAVEPIPLSRKNEKKD